MPLREVNNVHIADGEVNDVHLVAGGGTWSPNRWLRNALAAALIYPVWLTLPRVIS